MANKELWLIDHGSCLYYHYRWDGWENKATEPFQYIKDHVLLSLASRMEEADTMCREFIDEEVLHHIVQMIPDEWITWESQNLGPEQVRSSYFRFLNQRLQNSKQFIREAHAAKALI